MMNEKSAKILRHILFTRINRADSRDAHIAYTTALQCLNYALNNDIQALAQYDYYDVEEEGEENE